MYGREYSDWCDKTRIAEQIDEFIAALPADDRKWALAILRERHTVYKDAPSLGTEIALQQLQSRHPSCGVFHTGGSVSTLGSLLGF